MLDAECGVRSAEFGGRRSEVGVSGQWTVMRGEAWYQGFTKIRPRTLLERVKRMGSGELTLSKNGPKTLGADVTCCAATVVEGTPLKMVSKRACFWFRTWEQWQKH